MSNSDPGGTKIQIIVEEKDLDSRCGGRVPYIVWTFAIPSGAPCDGYLVQQIDVRCSKMSCIFDSQCPTTYPRQPDYSFWEVWEYKKGEKHDAGYIKFLLTDQARSTPAELGTCGYRVSVGSLKYFCKSTTGELKTDPLWKKGKTYGRNLGSMKCETSVSNLNSSDTPPSWWSNKPDDGPAYRYLSHQWSCCCDSDYAKAWASPD